MGGPRPLGQGRRLGPDARCRPRSPRSCRPRSSSRPPGGTRSSKPAGDWTQPGFDDARLEARPRRLRHARARPAPSSARPGTPPTSGSAARSPCPPATDLAGSSSSSTTTRTSRSTSTASSPPRPAASIDLRGPRDPARRQGDPEAGRQGRPRRPLPPDQGRAGRGRRAGRRGRAVVDSWGKYAQVRESVGWAVAAQPTGRPRLPVGSLRRPTLLELWVGAAEIISTALSTTRRSLRF